MGQQVSSQDTPNTTATVVKTDEEWRKQLTADQFRILRWKGTEMPGSGEYDKHFVPSGFYKCVGCDAPLYPASAKFNSGTGWPAFHSGIPGAIHRQTDWRQGPGVTEITCANCDGHLGHVFKGEWMTRKFESNERHCVNSICLKFEKQEFPESQ
ncbi:hypothetical protein HK100_007929 [Physocladia obscura]|uniref:Peptide-methionine (R)-S-oxide reductase n=1 Tax=Physocladia obscura TaxID=109957 RepID=A0AAD5SND2_9FUNG|nr:hypothetical protein HK100_007929 [Physocladia obscura]